MKKALQVGAMMAGAMPPIALRAQAVARDTSGPPALTCFRIDLGAWAPPLGLGEDTSFTLPPRRISVAAVADTSRLRFVRGARHVRATEVRPGSVHRDGYWVVGRPDSDEVIFTTGFSGVVLRLRPAGAGWRGVAETFWDFPRQAQRADVKLVPVACSP
jgi:hypothetical protein